MKMMKWIGNIGVGIVGIDIDGIANVGIDNVRTGNVVTIFDGCCMVKVLGGGLGKVNCGNRRIEICPIKFIPNGGM
ncbi:hypothetical protein L6452_01666 [Arctium lappa]|uniref:Uncharacterized protein n=1 Tax=Arctium lappa TaxID=4217 RepID=A0ACB9FI74_ARCLA|nr:hypothetical protein L6452_01666 [Arctium lappa]